MAYQQHLEQLKNTRWVEREKAARALLQYALTATVWLWFAQGVLQAYAVAQSASYESRVGVLQSLPSSSTLHTPSSPCSLSWRCSMGCKRLRTL